MDNTMVPSSTKLPAAVLFSPSECWGWRFRDLSTAALEPFPHNRPCPTMPALPDESAFLKAQAPRRRWCIFWAIIVFIACWIIATVIEPSAVPGQARDFNLAGWLLMNFGVLAAGAILYTGIWFSQRAYHRFETQLPGFQPWVMNYAAGVQHYYELDQQWQRDKARHEEDILKRLQALPEWGVLRPRRTTGRIDVYGGSPGEWDALIVTLGASILGSGSSLSIIDLSQNSVASDLYSLSRQHGFNTWMLSLPEQQKHFNLLSAMSQDEVTDVLVEALHSDDKEANNEGRAIDARIIGGVCHCLSSPLTLSRIHAGLLVLLRQESASLSGRELLSDKERAAIFDLFQEDFLSVIRQRIGAIEAHLYVLRQVGEESDVEDGFSLSEHALRVIELSQTGSTLNNDSRVLKKSIWCAEEQALLQWYRSTHLFVERLSPHTPLLNEPSLPPDPPSGI